MLRGYITHTLSNALCVHQAQVQGHWLSVCGVVPVPQRTLFVVPATEVRSCMVPALCCESMAWSLLNVTALERSSCLQQTIAGIQTATPLGI